MPKEDGKERIIYVQCATDRFVHRTIASFLCPMVDSILSSCAWAYRRGLNRKWAILTLSYHMEEVFWTGIKTDVQVFFDRGIEKEGLKMARYCEDFVILSKDLSANEILIKVRKSL